MVELFSKKVAVPAEVLINQVAGESVLLNLDGGRYFGLDDIGTDMWRALTSGATIQDAYDKLLTEFEVDATTLKNDLTALINRLVEHRLIALVDS